MGISLSQWRAAIGSFSGGLLHHTTLCKGTVGYAWTCREESSTPWFTLLVLATLLIIGGVELNPGPSPGEHDQTPSSAEATDTETLMKDVEHEVRQKFEEELVSLEQKLRQEFEEELKKKLQHKREKFDQGIKQKILQEMKHRKPAPSHFSSTSMESRYRKSEDEPRTSSQFQHMVPSFEPELQELEGISDKSMNKKSATEDESRTSTQFQHSVPSFEPELQELEGISDKSMNKKSATEDEPKTSSQFQHSVPSSEPELQELEITSKIATRNYEKTIGFANMSGELYEVKLAALLFSRRLGKEETFHIASNMKAAGAFDDIVLQLEQRTIFLQLKHREVPRIIKLSHLIQQEKKDFSLLRYYKSYCDIKQRWTQDKELQFCGKFENALFIVYTNATLEEGIGKSLDSTEWNSLLGTGGKFLYFTEDQCPLNSVDSSDYREFLSQLMFLTEQATVKELDNLIKEELKNICGTESIYAQFLSAIQKWWRESNYFLTNEMHFWKQIVQLCVTNISESKLKEVSSLCLTFSEDYLCKIRKFFPRDGEILHIVTKGTSGTTALSVLKVYQSLSGKLHLLVDGSTLQSHWNEVLALWGRWCNLLVVVDDGNVPDKFLQNHHIKQLIYISGTEHKGTFIVLHDDPVMNQLDEASQARVLSALVHFQGYDVPLGAITGSNQNIQHAVPADTIVQLLTDKLVLGEYLTGDLDYYIPRTVQLNCQVNDAILSHIEPDSAVTLAVSGLSQTELHRLMPHGKETSILNKNPHQNNKCKIVVIDKEEDFLKMAEACENVHWLHRDNDIFVWKKSRGDTVILEKYFSNKTSETDHVDSVFDEKYFSNKTSETDNVDSVFDVPHHVVLVSAEPGMGKSTLLTHLAIGTKQSHPVMWVIRVNLNDFTQKLHAFPDSLKLNQVVDFLVEVSGIKAEWKQLFKLKFMTMENICVLFDGYDEISPDHANKVALMMRCLQTAKLQKLWVTTRPVMKEKLERKLSTLAFTLKPFSQTDQRNFLFKFWKLSMPHIDKSILQKFIIEVLQLTETNLNDREMEFTGIPLQSMMLAESFEYELGTYSETGKMSLPQRFDLLQLYNRFVDRKLQIYYEKNKIDITRPGILYDYDHIKQLFQHNHMISALFALRMPEFLYKNCISESDKEGMKIFQTKFHTGKEKTGIIQNIIDDRPLFIHRTFAEYFAALWFTMNLKNEKVSTLLSKFLFEGDKQVIRNFFDRILAQSFDLHIAVLNLNVVSIQTLVSENQVNINARDHGGRTALHLAVMNYINTHHDSTQMNYSKTADEAFPDDFVHTHRDEVRVALRQIVAILLEHGADPNIKDSVLCWTPLSIADRIRAPLVIIDMLLGKKAESSDLIQTKVNSRNNKYQQKVMSVACTEGLVHLVTFMLECGLRVGYRITDGTLLHVAARYGHLRLVQLLVERGADIEAGDGGLSNRTPLMWAVHQGHIEVVKYLIQKGATVSARDIYGRSALLVAAGRGHLQIFKLLSEHNKDTIISDVYDSNVLHNAAASGNIELTKLILNTMNLDLDCQSKHHYTPVWRAADANHPYVVQFLCERGANLNVQDTFNGWTALHCAVVKDNLQIVQCLVQHDASLIILDNKGRKPFDIALEYNRNDIVNFLQQAIQQREAGGGSSNF